MARDKIESPLWDARHDLHGALVNWYVNQDKAAESLGQ
jgi:hypothetical protein